MNSFAQHRRVWCNTDNFPKGGWPGEPVGARSACIYPRTGALCLTLEKLEMKKSLVALAALAFAGVASAQSSVTLFGVVDAAYEHLSGSALPGSVNKLVQRATTAPAASVSVARKTSVVA